MRTPRVENLGCHSGFTLVELLIVIGLLGALATLVLSSLTVTRTKSLDNGIVQKELADIQRAFQSFAADCAPTQADYKKITKYGLAVLMKYGNNSNDQDGGGYYLDGSDSWDFDEGWDPARGKGWRGPYIGQESVRRITIGSGAVSTSAQPYDSSGRYIPVVCTPYVNDDGSYDGNYYRVIPNADAATNGVTDLYVVAPFDLQSDDHSGSLPADEGNYKSYRKEYPENSGNYINYYRPLILD